MNFLLSTHRRPPFTLPATLPVTRIFFYYSTRTQPEVKKTYPSQPAHNTALKKRFEIYSTQSGGLSELSAFKEQTIYLHNSTVAIKTYKDQNTDYTICMKEVYVLVYIGFTLSLKIFQQIQNLFSLYRCDQDIISDKHKREFSRVGHGN